MKGQWSDKSLDNVGYILRGPESTMAMSTLLTLKMAIHTVGVEDTGHADVNAVLTVVAIRERLRDTLTLVITCARTNRVHIAPAVDQQPGLGDRRHGSGAHALFFVLWVHLGVAVHLCPQNVSGHRRSTPGFPYRTCW